MSDFYIFNNGLMTENTMSGSDQRVLNWSRAFSQAGHAISVFTSSPGAVRFRPFGFKIYITGRLFLKSNAGLFLVYLWRALKSCLLQFGIGLGREAVIYSSCDLLADVLPALCMKFRKPSAKLIVGMHLLAPNPFKGFKNLYRRGFKIPSLPNLYYFLFQRFLIYALRSSASLILVSNNSDRGFLLKKGFPGPRILVTYGACDASFGDEVLETNKSYDAVYVGRFHVQKGFPDLLEVWKRVISELPDARLIIMGEDITAGNIRQFIDRNGLRRNIEFLGFVGGRRKYEYLKLSKLCIFPSYYESFGMVALEAMSCGVPVVAYDLPVFREIYPRGMLRVPVADRVEMARAIIALLRDEQKRSLISTEALYLSRRFRWEDTASDILETLGG